MVVRRLLSSCPPIVIAALIAVACGSSKDHARGFEGLVREDIHFSRGHKTAERRAQLQSVQSVHCDRVEKFAKSEVAGCTIHFSQIGAERWFVLISDRLYVQPCPTRPGPLASLLADVCGR